MGNQKKTAALFLLFLIVLSVPGRLGAQEWATKILLSDQAVLSMVTIYPGEALYSMFGHTAIRVKDPVNGIDLLYNYGQSSVPFDTAFIPRFVQGDLPFILGVSETPRSYDYYINYENRSIYEQVLNLSGEQKQGMFNFLAENARKENRTYIYDFFFDNCTTRIRDMFDQLFGGRMKYEQQLFEGTPSYREEIAPYLEGKAWVKFGIDLVLGMPTDEIPGRDRQLYLPLQLVEAVESADLETEEGPVPLVGESFFVYEQTREPPSAPPVTPEIIFWGLLLLSLGFSLFPFRTEKPRRFFDTLLFALAGLVGGASVMLWALSGYVMTHWNLNLLWAWPTHLVVVLFLPKKGGNRLSPLSVYLGLAAAVSFFAILGAPLLPQDFPGAAYPFALSLTLRATLRVGRSRLIGSKLV